MLCPSSELSRRDCSGEGHAMCLVEMRWNSSLEGQRTRLTALRKRLPWSHWPAKMIPRCHRVKPNLYIISLCCSTDAFVVPPTTTFADFMVDCLSLTLSL